MQVQPSHPNQQNFTLADTPIVSELETRVAKAATLIQNKYIIVRGTGEDREIVAAFNSGFKAFFSFLLASIKSKKGEKINLFYDQTRAILLDNTNKKIQEIVQDPLNNNLTAENVRKAQEIIRDIGQPSNPEVSTINRLLMDTQLLSQLAQPIATQLSSIQSHPWLTPTSPTISPKIESHKQEHFENEEILGETDAVKARQKFSRRFKFHSELKKVTFDKSGQQIRNSYQALHAAYDSMLFHQDAVNDITPKLLEKQKEILNFIREKLKEQRNELASIVPTIGNEILPQQKILQVIATANSEGIFRKE